MESFVASVQYDDWKGTAAADDAGERDTHALLREKGVYNSTRETIIGVKLRISENHGGRVQAPSVTALIVDVDTYDNVKGLLESQDGPVPVKQVEVEITLEEFMGLFKRFSVVLTKKDLDLAEAGRTPPTINGLRWQPLSVLGVDLTLPDRKSR